MPDYLRLLNAGINVVSTTSTGLVYPPAYYSVEWRDQMEVAAKAGDSSFFASGVFPGFGSDQLALTLATQSKKIDRITVTEVSLNDHYPVADVMMDGMGFGRELEFEPMLKTPGFIEMAWKAPIHLMADALGAEVSRFAAPWTGGSPSATSRWRSARSPRGRAEPSARVRPAW